MTEAGRQAMFASEACEALVDARAGFEFGEHRLDAIACAAVNWTAQRTQRGKHRGEQVGAGARDDARGERRGVELVLGACDQHAIERLDFAIGGCRSRGPFRAGAPAMPGPPGVAGAGGLSRARAGAR